MFASIPAPPRCGACPKPAALTCAYCGNMSYCSAACQWQDKGIHSILCGTFKDFDKRPGDNFRRAILFPEAETKPRFVWLEFEGSQTFKVPTDAAKKEYIGDQASPHMPFDVHRSIDQQSDYSIQLWHRRGFLEDGSEPNFSVDYMMGAELASHWHGPLLVQGCIYRLGEEYGEKSKSANEVKPLIPVDLDTTSFNPTLAYLRSIAISKSRVSAGRLDVQAGMGSITLDDRTRGAHGLGINPEKRDQGSAESGKLV